MALVKVGAKGIRNRVARICVINFVSLIKYKWVKRVDFRTKKLISLAFVDGISIFFFIWH